MASQQYIFNAAERLEKINVDICEILVAYRNECEREGTNAPYPENLPVWELAYHELIGIQNNLRDLVDEMACDLPG